MRAEFTSSPFVKMSKNMYLFFILMGLGLIYAQIFPINKMPWPIFVFTMGLIVLASIYSFKKGQRLFNVEITNGIIFIKNKGRTATFPLEEIESIQVLGPKMPQFFFYLIKITLRKETEGIREFQFIADDNGKDQKYLLGPFEKNGGKIERRVFGFE